MFFISSISRVLTFSCVCWGGNILKQDRDIVDRIIKKAESVIGKRPCTLTYILHDDTHPLKTDFDNKIIQRSRRFIVPRIIITRYAGSSVPSGMRGFNMRIGGTQNDNY